MGKEGQFEGDAEVAQIVLSGQLNGALRCRHLTILADGLFTGEVVCESLTIEEGGRFNGSCSHKPYRPTTDHPANAEMDLHKSMPPIETDQAKTKELNTAS